MHRQITRLLVCAAVCFVQDLALADEDLGVPFGMLTLVDEVDTSDPTDTHTLYEDPPGSSSVATVLGKPARVLPMGDDAQVIAYRLGAGKGLVPGKPYVLVVEYPEDTGRQFVVINRGAAMTRTYATGQTSADARHAYTYPFPESLKYPLSGKWESVRTLFWLGEKAEGVKKVRDATAATFTDTVTQGFWVVIGRFRKQDSPLDAGAAVARIRLFAVPDTTSLDMPVHYPPSDLPRRHAFWREEMADEQFESPDPSQRMFASSVDYFETKMKQAKFLGMNTFARHLLVFGYTQQWDSTGGGGNDWYYTSQQADLWGKLVAAATAHGLDILPYFEYAGSLGGGAAALGSQRRCRPLGDRAQDWYTDVYWSEIACADVTDPDFQADVDKLLDATVTSFAGSARFVGAWFRTRNSNWPMSFTDATLARFGAQANGGVAPTRQQLLADGALLQKYYAWWFTKRRDFLTHIRDYLKAKVSPEAVVLFTGYVEETLHGASAEVTPTDDVSSWETVDATPPWQYQFSPVDWSTYVASGTFLSDSVTMHPPSAVTLANHYPEDDHSAPPPDPATYQAVDDVMMTMPFSRLFTTSDPRPFDAFRAKSGLAIARHFNLNEEDGQDASTGPGPMSKLVGYFVSDADRAGPYSMLAEARAMAFGDPRYLAYLSSSNFARGFPEATRAFNAAFLALPALPSTIVSGASTDAELVVREIKTSAHGTYYAVVNTGMKAKTNASIALPAHGKIQDLVAGKEVGASPGSFSVTLGPGAMMALVVGGDAAATTDGGVGNVPDGGVGADGGSPGHASSGCGCTVGGGPASTSPFPAVALLLCACVAIRVRRIARRTSAATPSPVRSRVPRARVE